MSLYDGLDIPDDKSGGSANSPSFAKPAIAKRKWAPRAALAMAPMQVAKAKASAPSVPTRPPPSMAPMQVTAASAASSTPAASSKGPSSAVSESAMRFTPMTLRKTTAEGAEQKTSTASSSGPAAPVPPPSASTASTAPAAPKIIMARPAVSSPSPHFEDIHHFENVDDEYNPDIPNSYELVIEERELRLKQKRQELKLARQMEEIEAERVRLKKQREADEKAGTVPMGRGRGRGRGVSMMPAWMKKQIGDKADEGGTVPGLSAVAAPMGRVPEPATRSDSASTPLDDHEQPRKRARGEDVAKSLMAQWGYQQGKGLGRNEDGITAPLRATKTGGGTGVIKVNKRDAARDPSKGYSAGAASGPSRVVILKGMVTPDEVDAELQAETMEECSKYGPVSSLQVHVVKQTKSVRILVAYTTLDAAAAALKAFDGRMFDKRRVDASYYNEEAYARGNFEQ